MVADFCLNQRESVYMAPRSQTHRDVFNHPLGQFSSFPFVWHRTEVVKLEKRAPRSPPMACAENGTHPCRSNNPLPLKGISREKKAG